jgi:hypothetical protein
MGTTCTEIYDLFLSSIEDYRLDAIFTSSGSFTFGLYLEPWLLNSIVDFDIANQDLTYTVSGSATEGTFTATLNLENQIILSLIMSKYWLAKTVQNILQMNNSLQDRDFKTFSQAQNLKAKQDLYNSKREEVSQRLAEYGYKYNVWADWKIQNFDHS